MKWRVIACLPYGKHARFNIMTALFQSRKRIRGVIMRTTLNIEDDLLQKASKLTGIREKTSLVKLGLEALISRESGKRLAKLGGSEKNLVPIPRRRTARKA
jgi:Arc/MetJ family transcription regulator